MLRNEAFLSQNIFKIVLILIAIAFLFFNSNPALAQSQQTSSNIELAREMYLKNCSSCHIPIAAEVLPTETWKALLSNPEQHYGESLPKMVGLTQYLIWQYLSNNSRSLLKDEPLPMYVANSRYFKALHPQVELPKPANIQTCASCHPNASKLNYRL
jgi:mono/diheme cytochrome c family protein